MTGQDLRGAIQYREKRSLNRQQFAVLKFSQGPTCDRPLDSWEVRQVFDKHRWGKAVLRSTVASTICDEATQAVGTELRPFFWMHHHPVSV